MYKGIVAYIAKNIDNKILIIRAYADRHERMLTNNWDELADFLVEDKGQAFHIVWNLAQFANTIFALLPDDKRLELSEQPRVYYNNSKIFYVDRLLGITVTKQIKGNFYHKAENNFYAIQRWVSGMKPPSATKDIAKLGEQIVEALELLEIYPDKLTSPIGAYNEVLEQYELPSIHSNRNSLFVDACNYCLPMMEYEWREGFETNQDKTYPYDMVAAYPSFIAHLPNTDECRIIHSNKFIISDWAILKGRVKVAAKVSPIAYSLNGEYVFPKSGEWDTYLTNEELIWLFNHNTGSFRLEDGYFFEFLTNEKPYKELVHKLFNLRQTKNDIAQVIMKKTAQGISGKLDQENKDGNLGELYNPVLAAMVRSRCRLAVADFIYNNKLQDSLVSIQVDGIQSTKKLNITNHNIIGSWRLKERKEITK